MNKPAAYSEDKAWNEADEGRKAITYRVLMHLQFKDYDSTAIGDLLQASLKEIHFFNLVIRTHIANNMHGYFEIEAIRAITDLDGKVYHHEISEIRKWCEGFLAGRRRRA